MSLAAVRTILTGPIRFVLAVASERSTSGERVRGAQRSATTERVATAKRIAETRRRLGWRLPGGQPRCVRRLPVAQRLGQVAVSRGGERQLLRSQDRWLLGGKPLAVPGVRATSWPLVDGREDLEHLIARQGLVLK